MVVCCADAWALDRGGSFLRPAAGESLLIGFAQTTKNALRRVARLPHRRHRYASCSTMSAHGTHPWAPAQRGEAVPRLIRFAHLLLPSCGPAPTRATQPLVPPLPPPLPSLRLPVPP